MKIKLLTKLIYWWDVFFTLVDIYQLKVYMWLRKKRTEAQTIEIIREKYKKCQDYASWEDVE
jgi:hypothetical protein